MNKLNSRGFSPIAVILLVAVIALVGYAGWTVYNAQPDDDAPAATTSQNDAIENAEDLDAANEELNAQDIDTQLDTSEIDDALAE